MLVFTTETEINAPIKYAPPSPKNICAVGKLNNRKIEINNMEQNNI